jgi:predicted RNase H-like HicB family nuclease
MHRYLVVIEPTATGFSAYSPDLAGCVATGASRADVERAIREAIEFHLDGLREDGQPIPPGGTSATYIEVAA